MAFSARKKKSAEWSTDRYSSLLTCQHWAVVMKRGAEVAHLSCHLSPSLASLCSKTFHSVVKQSMVTHCCYFSGTGKIFSTASKRKERNAQPRLCARSRIIPLLPPCRSSRLFLLRLSLATSLYNLVELTSRKSSLAQGSHVVHRLRAIRWRR